MAMPADGWPCQVLRDLQVDKPGEAASLLMGHPQGEHLLLECRAVLAQGKVRQARELKAQLERLISAEAHNRSAHGGARAVGAWWERWSERGERVGARAAEASAGARAGVHGGPHAAEARARHGVDRIDVDRHSSSVGEDS